MTNPTPRERAEALYLRASDRSKSQPFRNAFMEESAIEITAAEQAAYEHGYEDGYQNALAVHGIEGA